jgi:hypothetical protein
MSRPVFSTKRLLRRALVLTHRFVFGSTLAVILVVGLVLFGSLTWVKHKLAQGWVFGDVTVQASELKVGWDLSLRSADLQVHAPGVHFVGRQLRARPILAKNFLAVYPKIRISLNSAHLKLSPSPTNSGTGKPARFPELRWPMPWRIEVAEFLLSQSDSLLVRVSDIQMESRGMLGLKTKATVQAGSWGHFLPAALQLGIKVEATSRWKGPDLRYRVAVHTFQGDSLFLIGARDRANLTLADDSLTIHCATPGLYATDSLALALAVYRDLAAHVQLSTRKRVTYSGSLQATADTVWMAGPIRAQIHWHGGLKRAWFKLNLQQREKGKAQIQGEVPFQALSAADTSVKALAMLRPDVSRFSADVENVFLDVGGHSLPADMQLREGTWVPGQMVAGEVVTAAGSKFNLVYFLRKAWLFAFDGKVAAKEPWAHGWTDTNVTFDYAKVRGQVREGSVKVQATAYGVQAYKAEADSIQCWNTITRSQYRLDSARIFQNGRLWKGDGFVTWKKRGVFLTRGVDLEFRASNPVLGSGWFRMPFSGQLVAHAENMAVHDNPYTLLGIFRPYQPRVTGDWEWNLVTQTGKTDVTVTGLQEDSHVQATLKGRWSPQFLEVEKLDLSGQDLDASASFQVQMNGQPFYTAYQGRFSDLTRLDLDVREVDVAQWISKLTGNTLLQSGVLIGNLKYSPEEGIRGRVDLKRPSFSSQPEGLVIGDFTALGKGDTLHLSVDSRSKSEPFFNTAVEMRILHPLTRTPEFLLDGRWHDSLRLAGRAALDLSRTLRGAVDMMGSLALPGESGHLRKMHLLTQFEIPTQGGFKQWKASSHVLEGLFDSHRLPPQRFTGKFKMESGTLHLDSVKSVDSTQKVLWAEATYQIGPPAILHFRINGDAFALQFQKGQFIQLNRLNVNGEMNAGVFQIDAGVEEALYSMTRGSVSAEGAVEGFSLRYVQPPDVMGKPPTPSQIQIKGTMSKTLVAHKIRLGPEELKRLFGTLMQWTKGKGKGPASKGASHANGAGKSRAMDLNISIDTRGQDNRIETEVGRLHFTGDVQVKGVYPYLLMNGTVASLKGGEIGQKNQAYELRDLELKWQNAIPGEGTISMEGDKKLKVDCDPQTQKTCHVTIHFNGRLDDAKFYYETDCGGAEGEAIKPTAIINSVASGCFTGDLSGGDNQGDYGKTLINLFTPYVNSTLTKAFTVGSAGLIQNAKVTGLDNLVAGENAQAVLDEPVALNLESKEKYRIRLLGRGGFFPASKQAAPYDLKVVVEWRPPFDEWVQDSVWKNRLKDRITVDAGIETRPEERNTDVERQVRQKAGLKYKYQFWKFW